MRAPYDNDKYPSITPDVYARIRAWTGALYILPLAILFAVGLDRTGWRSSLLLLFGSAVARRGLTGFLLALGSYWWAWRLGAPLWWVLALAVVVVLWGALAKAEAEFQARWRPPRPKTHVGNARCQHLGPAAAEFRTCASLGRWADALDASLDALADHPHDRSDCLAELALQTAEVAIAANAPDIALECGESAPRLTRSQSKTRSAVDVRASLARARAHAMKGDFERAWCAVQSVDRNTKSAKALERQVEGATIGIRALTKRGDPAGGVEGIIGSAGRALGIRGDAAFVALLDYADWFRIAERYEESLALYHIARAATEFDRYVRDATAIPKVLGPRWSLRGRRWAQAVCGQLRTRLALNQRPSDSLAEAADSAATVLFNLNEWPALVVLKATIEEVESKFGPRRDDAHPALPAAESMHTRHKFVVFDWTARRNWEKAVEATRKAATRQSGTTTLSGASVVAADATWLDDGGTDIARAGVGLARALDDILGDVYVTGLRTMSMRLGALGLREEALEAAQEVVRLRRRMDGTNQEPIWHLGIPLWRLGICREEVGLTAEGLETHLESLVYFRQSAAEDDANRLTCAEAVSECVVRLMRAERYDEALPLALETVRRYGELASSSDPTRDVYVATQNLATVYDHLGRHVDSAETSENLAQTWAASGDAIVAHASAAESYWRASVQWRSAKAPVREIDALDRAHGHLAQVDDPAYSPDWQFRLRYLVGARLGELRIQGEAFAEAITPLRDALENLRKRESLAEPRQVEERQLLMWMAVCTARSGSQEAEETIKLLREALDLSLTMEHDADGSWIDYIVDSAYRLATMYWRASRPEKALTVADEVLSAIPPPSPRAIWLRYSAYLAATALGSSDRARSELESAVAMANIRSGDDPARVDVFARCVIFVAARDDARAMMLIQAAKAADRAPDRHARSYLWEHLADLERAIGLRPILDRIREELPMNESDSGL